MDTEIEMWISPRDICALAASKKAQEKVRHGLSEATGLERDSAELLFAMSTFHKFYQSFYDRCVETQNPNKLDEHRLVRAPAVIHRLLVALGFCTFEDADGVEHLRVDDQNRPVCMMSKFIFKSFTHGKPMFASPDRKAWVEANLADLYALEPKYTPFLKSADYYAKLDVWEYLENAERMYLYPVHSDMVLGLQPSNEGGWIRCIRNLVHVQGLAWHAHEVLLKRIRRDQEWKARMAEFIVNKFACVVKEHFDTLLRMNEGVNNLSKKVEEVIAWGRESMRRRSIPGTSCESHPSSGFKLGVYEGPIHKQRREEALKHLTSLASFLNPTSEDFVGKHVDQKLRQTLEDTRRRVLVDLEKVTRDNISTDAINSIYTKWKDEQAGLAKEIETKTKEVAKRTSIINHLESLATGLDPTSPHYVGHDFDDTRRSSLAEHRRELLEDLQEITKHSSGVDTKAIDALAKWEPIHKDLVNKVTLQLSVSTAKKNLLRYLKNFQIYLREFIQERPTESDNGRLIAKATALAQTIRNVDIHTMNMPGYYGIKADWKRVESLMGDLGGIDFQEMLPAVKGNSSEALAGVSHSDNEQRMRLREKILLFLKSFQTRLEFKMHSAPITKPFLTSVDTLLARVIKNVDTKYIFVPGLLQIETYWKDKQISIMGGIQSSFKIHDNADGEAAPPRDAAPPTARRREFPPSRHPFYLPGYTEGKSLREAENSKEELREEADHHRNQAQRNGKSGSPKLLEAQFERSSMREATASSEVPQLPTLARRNEFPTSRLPSSIEKIRREEVIERLKHIQTYFRTLPAERDSEEKRAALLRAETDLSQAIAKVEREKLNLQELRDIESAWTDIHHGVVLPHRMHGGDDVLDMHPGERLTQTVYDMADSDDEEKSESGDEWMDNWLGVDDDTRPFETVSHASRRGRSRGAGPRSASAEGATGTHQAHAIRRRAASTRNRLGEVVAQPRTSAKSVEPVP